MNIANRISPMLWFDGNAEEAANFYLSIFQNSRLTGVMRCGENGPAPKGSVLTVGFELDGIPFTALNGGPMYKFTEAISLVVRCENQAEVDYYWERLLEGGGNTQACGWLKDRYGLSWQVTPVRLIELMTDPDPARAGRVMQAMMKMIKIDIATLESAAAG